MTDISKHIIPEIYSDVMFQLARDAAVSDAVMQDLKSVAAALRDQADFVFLLSDTKLPEQEKVQTVRRVFDGRVCPLTLDFLSVLARRNRLGFLHSIANRYEALLDEKKHCRLVEATVAGEMNDRQVEKLKNDLRQAIRSEVKLELTVNPRIIGGIIIRMGDTVVDNSVRTVLDRTVQTVLQRSKKKFDAPDKHEET